MNSEKQAMSWCIHPDKPSLEKSAVESCKIHQRWIHDEAAAKRVSYSSCFNDVRFMTFVQQVVPDDAIGIIMSYLKPSDMLRWDQLNCRRENPYKRIVDSNQQGPTHNHILNTPESLTEASSARPDTHIYEDFGTIEQVPDRIIDDSFDIIAKKKTKKSKRKISLDKYNRYVSNRIKAKTQKKERNNERIDKEFQKESVSIPIVKKDSNRFDMEKNDNNEEAFVDFYKEMLSHINEYNPVPQTVTFEDIYDLYEKNQELMRPLPVNIIYSLLERQDFLVRPVLKYIQRRVDQEYKYYDEDNENYLNIDDFIPEYEDRYDDIADMPRWERNFIYGFYYH